MGWMLVVSEDETFQREAIRRCGDRSSVVGATGASSACSLVRAIDVETILVDALDDVGRCFLAILRNLPPGSLPDVIVVDPDGETPLFATTRDVAAAIERSASAASAAA